MLRFVFLLLIGSYGTTLTAQCSSADYSAVDYYTNTCGEYQFQAFLENATIQLDGCGELIFTPPDYDDESVSVISSLPDNIRVFPNPFQEYVMIESMEGTIVDVYSQLGQKINSYPIIEGMCTINTQNYLKGGYYFKITTHSGQYISKQIKY